MKKKSANIRAFVRSNSQLIPRNPASLVLLALCLWTGVAQACDAPVSSPATSLKASGATANWTCVSCPGSFIVEYGPGGFTPGTGASPGTNGTIILSGPGTTSAVITGLLPNTTYSVYVRQDCGAGTYSPNSVMRSFITLELIIGTSIISPTEYCQSESVMVPFNIGGTGTFDAGNVFTAELSDSSGSFASPTVIGTLTQTTAGIIAATIPSTQIPGVSYRIRVVGSNPPVTGSDNGEGIIISDTLTVANVVLPATNITHNSFDAHWTTSPGATRYVLEVSKYFTFTAPSLASDLIISEYLEGSGNEQYIQIFNGTGAPVNLSDYRLRLYQDGSITAPVMHDVQLSGTLAHANTLVYKNPAATLYAGAATANTAVAFNGNDAIALFKISTGTEVDIIGRIGEDPGTEWTTGSYSTLDKTLIRRDTVRTGITANPASGFPTLVPEWELFNIDDVTYLGGHAFVYDTPSFVEGYDPIILYGPDTSWVTVTGLQPSTTYYYRLRSANACGICSQYSVVMSVTTGAPPDFTGGGGGSMTPIEFDTVCVNSTPPAKQFLISGSNLQSGNIEVGPLSGYAFSTTGNAGSWQSSLSLPQSGGNFSQTVYVQFTPTTVGSYNGNIQIVGGGGGYAIPATGRGATPPVQPSAITGKTSVCPNTAGIAYSVINDPGVTYTWAFPSGWTGLSGQGTNAITITSPASGAGSITVTPKVGGCTGTQRTLYVTVNTSGNIWTADAGTSDWFTDGNWACGVPTATTDVVIPAAPSGGRFPVIGGTLDAATRNLTINPGATLTINYGVTGFTPDGELAVHGALTNTTAGFGSGCLTMKSGSSIAGAVNVSYLKIDGNTSLASGALIHVMNELALQSGTFNTANGTVVLKSSASKTAYVNDFDFPTAGPYGTLAGNLTIERYIPPTAGPSTFHYIGGVTGGSAGSKWIDDFGMGVVGTDGYITPSDCDPADPRTADTSNYGGLFTYHESNVTDCYLTGWKVENSGYAVTPGRGVAARIGNGIIIDETGAHQSGNVTVSGLTKTGSNTTSFSKGYNLVSNPFFAPINWNEVAADNAGTWDGAAYVYDPSSGTYSAYNFLTSPLVINTNQAFFVRAGGGNGSYSFTFNADTRTKGSNAVFYRQPGYEYSLDITVQSANGKSDRTLVVFDETFNDVFDNGFDAMKLYNDAGIPSVYTKSGDDQQAIQALPLITHASTRSVPLSMLVTTTGVHTFTFDGVANFPQTSIIWLEDLKTGAIHYLRQNNTYTFSATMGDARDRFVIHFAPELLISTTMADCIGNNGAIALEQRGGIEWAFQLKDASDAVIASDVFTATKLLNQLSQGTYTLHLTHPVSGYATTMTIEVDGLQPVTAAIDAPVTEVLTGETFTVGAQTTGSATYTWQMGDQTSYTDVPFVSYSYALPGTYEITLTARNDDGCSAQSKVLIVVTKRDTVSTGFPTVDSGNIGIFEHGDVLYISQTFVKNTTARVTVYNALGKLIMKDDLKELSYKVTHQVQISDAAAGLYYVQVELENGKNALRKVMLGENK